MNSIPASQLVNVVPGVLGAGGNPLALNAVILTQSGSIAMGTVQGFATLASVNDWFGPTSQEAKMAAVYFGGFEGATTVPGLLYFAQYAAANVAAYLRGGSLAGMTLAQLQAFTGTLSLTVNGVSTTSASINLSSATSFTNAASLITTGLSSSSAVCTWDAQRQTFVITSPTTGAASTITVATAATLATGLKLTAATGATVSPGAVASTPAGVMSNVANVNQNWGLFTTAWEPDAAGKLAFAAWVTTQANRYAYVAWDSDAAPTAGPASGSFGVVTEAYNGVIPVYDATGLLAAFICAVAASLNFAETNGRATFAYRSQPGLVPNVTDVTTAVNLIANGYNFYGRYATSNDAFQFLQPGQCSGEWLWIDEYVNQIYLNAQLQLALLSLLAGVKSVPYNAQGYAMLRAAAMDPIQQALNFGSMRAGVTLSAVQVSQVNAAAGLRISDVLQTQGYYLQILDASAQVRASRGSPPMTLWYMSGGAIQKITLASIDVL